MKIKIFVTAILLAVVAFPAAAASILVEGPAWALTADGRP